MLISDYFFVSINYHAWWIPSKYWKYWNIVSSALVTGNVQGTWCLKKKKTKFEPKKSGIPGVSDNLIAHCGDRKKERRLNTCSERDADSLHERLSNKIFNISLLFTNSFWFKFETKLCVRQYIYLSYFIQRVYIHYMHILEMYYIDVYIYIYIIHLYFPNQPSALSITSVIFSGHVCPAKFKTHNIYSSLACFKLNAPTSHISASGWIHSSAFLP